MRVLIVSEWGPCIYGGVSSQVKLLSKWLVERGYDVYIMYKQGAYSNKHIKVRGILPLECVVVPPVLWEVKNIIRSIKPDLVRSRGLGDVYKRQIVHFIPLCVS